MAEDNRPLINKIFNPYPNLTGLKGLDLTGGKKYFIGSDKGLSALVDKDYTDPDITIGETLLKGLGSAGDVGLETILGVYDTAMRAPQGIMSLLGAKSPIAKEKESLKLAPQARQQDPSGDMGFGEISPDIFDPKFAPKDKKFVAKFEPKEPQLTMDDDETFGLIGDTKTDTVKTPTDTTDTTDTTSKADETPAVSEQDKLDELFTSALQSAADAREGQPTKRKTLEDYKKEFSEATGIDASGKVDKSGALMALGLALMQNKAGKGFNVGNMLSAVGEAGSKALPVFEKAKQQAKLAAAKAGEYALGKVAEDEATAKLEKEEMMKRENFYVVPKGKKGGPLGIAEAITQGKGEFVRVNKFELSKLDQNKNFNDNFEIVKASDYLDVAKEMMKAPEVKDQYSKTSKFIPLFSGADKDLGFYVQLPDANAGGNVKPAFVDDADSVIGQIQSMEQDLNRQEKDFKEIASLLNRTDIDVVSQLGQSVVQGFRNLGFDVGGDTTPIKQIQTLLTKLQAENAADILGESGKTLSDTDRKLVAEIVGGITFTQADAPELTRKLGRLYEVIISKGRKNVNEAYSKLKSAGVNINRESVRADPTASLVKGDDGIYDVVS